MGDMADYYREQELYIWPDPESLVEEPRITRLSKWKTRNGHEISIKDLTIDHLQNILTMLEQGRLTMPSTWERAFTRELKRRGKVEST